MAFEYLVGHNLATWVDFLQGWVEFYSVRASKDMIAVLTMVLQRRCCTCR